MSIINNLTVEQLRGALIVAMKPRATGYEYEEACPFCGGECTEGGWYHADDCDYIGVDPTTERWNVTAYWPRSRLDEELDRRTDVYRQMMRGFAADTISEQANVPANTMFFLNHTKET